METEILKDILQKIYMIQYVLIALLGLWRFKEYKDTGLKWFPFLMILTFVVEYIGFFTSEILNFTSNVIVYNIFYLFYFLFIFLVFKENVIDKNFKRGITAMMVMFLIVYITFIIISDFTKTSQSEIYTVGGVFTIISIALFYVDLLRTRRVMIVHYNMLFWISVGFLLFFIGYLPIRIMRTSYESAANLYYQFTILQYLLIIIMNVCFMVGLLVAKRKYLALR